MCTNLFLCLEASDPTQEKARVAEKVAEKEAEKVSGNLIFLLTTNVTLFCEQEAEKVVLRRFF